MKLQNLAHKVAFFVALLGLLNISSISKADSKGPDSWNGSTLRPYDGYGQKDNPILISSAEEFAFLLQNYDYNNGVNWGKYYRLENDIDMAACGWSYGIAYSENKSFRAYFDGAGHRISNLHIVVGDFNSEVNVGVFPQLGGDAEFVSVIENLEIENMTIDFKSTTYKGKRRFNIGGLVGKMMRNSIIRNCIVNGMKMDVQAADIDLSKDGSLQVGALVGKVQNDYADKKDKELDNIEIMDSYGKAVVNVRNIQGGKPVIETEQGQPHEGLRHGFWWYKKLDEYSFTPVKVTIEELPVDASGRHFKANITAGKASKFRWLMDGKPQQSTTDECTIPFDAKDGTIAVEVLDAKDKVIGTDAELVQPGDLKLVIEAQKIGSAYNLNSKIIGQGANALASEFVYSWRDMTLNEEVVGSSATLTGAKPGHTYLLVANHRRWKFCAISNYYSFTNPIYVNLHGINAEDAKLYTIDGETTYPVGNDSNDGLSPEKAVRTLKKAYSLLTSDKMGGNLIVIMGDYDADEFNYYISDSFTEKNPKYFEKNKKAIITGQYGNIANGRILFSTRSCLIDEDTRFENITIHGKNSRTDAVEILAQEHNLTFGYGILCDGYRAIMMGRGLVNGTNAPDLTIFGGHLDQTNMSTAHPENTICVLSGYYGRIIAGGQTTKLLEQTGNMHGTPRNPLRTNIVIDICNYKNPDSRTFDVGLAVAGQGNGSCYAITKIEVKGSSRVGRAIGGNIGYGREAWVKKNGQKSGRPTDSYFGLSTINILGGNVNEIYGANLGRCGKIINPDEEVNDTVSTYFYGKSVINISGGQVRNTIYGSGGGGVTGAAFDDNHHSFDPYMPYVLGNGDIAYGPYAKAKGKMPKVQVAADSVIDLNKTVTEINVSDNARLRGSIYGGGHGYSNQILTMMASSQAGSMFGDVYVNVSGGTVDGYIYGGGRGTTAYFDNNDLSGFPVANGKQQTALYFNRLAMVNGNTYVNISGGKVFGMVFAGGEGSSYRPVSETDPDNATNRMASVIGKTHLNISGEAEINDFVFGGGNYGNVLDAKSDPESGSTFVNVTGGKIKNSIYGGGHGHTDLIHPERSIVAGIEGDTHVSIHGGEFVWTPEPSRYDTVRYYGIYGGGRTASRVNGDTDVKVYKSLFSNQFMEESGLKDKRGEKPWDRFFTICGGGFGNQTEIMGNTNIYIDLKERAPIIDVFGGGLEGNVEGSTNITITGQTVARNVYGGSLVGIVGLKDMHLNGDLYTPNNDERNYQTRANIKCLSGNIYQVFGGGLMGNVAGETHIEIGSYDAEANRNLFVGNVYGGNDVSGTVAGSNNPRYGTNIDILGGTITGDVYGSGNGQYSHYDNYSPEYSKTSLLNSSVGREHPHVASTKINISGLDEFNKAVIGGSVYLGGNNTTVGQFVRGVFDRPDLGMLREVLIPNSGSARINIGDHVMIGSLVMGSNGEKLIDYIPSYTTDGTIWIKGFESDEDFAYFCRSVDMSCVPQLTFNSDRSFNNNYAIKNPNLTEYKTPGEMDAKDVFINDFVGGSSSGSMTSDSTYVYTLPTGVTITNNVIAGCKNAHFKYVETEGKDAGKTREFVGGFIPYTNPLDIEQKDRVQLNIFCQFAPTVPKFEENRSYFHGSKVFGGCYDYGVIYGNTSVNMHSDIIGPAFNTLEALEDFTDNNHVYGAQVFGAGRGENTEVIGCTNVTLSTATFNGKECEPKVLIVYGGGQLGGVATNSVYKPGYNALEKSGTNVYIKSGMVDEVFGGARMADIDGGAHVSVGYTDNSSKGKAFINTVYGGNDVSGNIALGTFKNHRGEEISTDTYVYITEKDGARPVIREIFAGGNGNYGTHSESETYASGAIVAFVRDIPLAGLPYPNLDKTYLDIAGGEIKYAFGGANNALVRHNTTIDVDYDGSIERLFGGNNKKDMNIQPTWNLYRGKVGTVYGGCNLANVIYYNEEEDRLIHPNTSGEVGLALNLIHPDFEAENVFGGCRMGTVQACKKVDGKLQPVVFASNQYGTYINIKAGKFGNVFGGNDVSGNIYNGTRIHIEGGEIYQVFGAGNGEYIYQYSPDVSEITECVNEKDGMHYYKIPAQPIYGGSHATDFQKIQAINDARPNIVKSFIEIGGGRTRSGARQMAKVTNAMFGGGNCATINSNDNRSGEIKLQIGDYCEIENLFMGSNGEPHQKPSYIKNILKYNNIETLSLSDESGKTLLDYHMDAVVMHGLPQDFQFKRNYDKCIIGSFFMGGNRGSLSTHGVLKVTFPRTLKIRDKIVGGSNRADIVFKSKDEEEDIIHLGGILWDGIDRMPEIDLEVNCLFEDEDGEEIGAQVYPGCYQSGKIEGRVNVTIND